MKQLKINLEHCYGIKKFDEEFDFVDHNIHLIYAANASMKTSFAKTLDDYKNNFKNVYDRISGEKGVCKISDLEGQVTHKNIFVIHSIDDLYEYKEDVASLLISPELKKKYSDIYKNIDSIKKEVETYLSTKSGLKRKDIEPILLKIFREKNFKDIWPAIEYKLNSNIEKSFGHIKYDLVFDEAVIKLLKDKDFQQKLNTYINIYEVLLNKSSILKKTDTSIFDHNNVFKIVENLKQNGFFYSEVDSNNNNEEVPIRSLRFLINGNYKHFNTSEELIQEIEKEIEAIEENLDYKKAFNDIDKIFEKPKAVNAFGQYIRNNKDILQELKIENLEIFEKQIWLSYFFDKKDLFIELINTIKSTDTEIKEIQEEAESSDNIKQWKSIIEEYRNNFLIINKKLEIDIDNKKDTVLGLKAFEVNISYNDGDNKRLFNNKKKAIDDSDLDLKDILSMGEKRVLYLLNVMFDIKVREKIKKELNENTLFIIDDIADSFDYQNKYAIIDYLIKVADINGFYQIILTHNYDFFRTLKKRVNLKSKSWIATKTMYNTTLKAYESKYDNPFLSWRNSIAKPDVLISLIPFIRNLIEYTQGTSIEDYKSLTSLLHIKAKTKSITVEDLIKIFNSHVSKINIKDLKKNIGLEHLIFDLIVSEAQKIYTKTQNTLDLESKIVLSIAIRLLIEDFMYNNIKKSDKTFSVDDILNNQTMELSNKYKELFSEKAKYLQHIVVINKVNLITPENIHLNSFMYEPILDMSTYELKQLYFDVKNLKDIY